MNKKTELFLAKIQTTYGTAEAGLDGDEYVEVSPDSKLDITPENDENPTATGTYDQNPSIPGAASCGVDLVFPMRSFGATAVPDWVTMAQAAGFSLATSLIVAENKHTLTWDGSKKDATVWKYGGGTGSVQLKKAHNCVFDFKIAADINKKAMFSLMGKGALTAIPAGGTKPSVTQNGALTPAVTKFTKSIIGSAVYAPLNFEITGQLPVEQRVSGDDFGYGQSEFTDAVLMLKTKVYAVDSPAVVDPYTAWMNSTTGATSFVWGPTGRKISISAASTQLKVIGDSQEGNIITWDLEIPILNNGLVIVVNNDTVA
jgi:hypothetical protein